jgi:hypothetical protein
LKTILRLIFKKSPDDDAFVVANAIFRSATTDETTILLSARLRSSALTDVCGFLCGYVASHPEMTQSVLDLVHEFFAMENISPGVANSVLRVIRAIADRGDRFDGVSEFRKSAEKWIKSVKAITPAKERGRCSAALQMLGRRTPPEGDSLPPLNAFVSRKWRSRKKWIDDALRDESDSDDNFGDLEDFIVEQSPPPDEHEEEDSTTYSSS